VRARSADSSEARISSWRFSIARFKGGRMYFVIRKTMIKKTSSSTKNVPLGSRKMLAVSIVAMLSGQWRPVTVVGGGRPGARRRRVGSALGGET